MVISDMKQEEPSALALLQEGIGSESESPRPSSLSHTSMAVATGGYEKVLYLTFDDGPVDGTQNVLRVLEEEGVQATMFCVGRHAQKRRRLYLRELRMPNLMVANHTYSHANGHYSRFYSDLWGVMSDVEHAQLVLGGRKYLRLAGRNVWRLPELQRNDRALSLYRRGVEIPKYEQLAKEGFYIYGWDVEWRFDHNSGRPLSTAERLAERIASLWKHRRTAQRGKVVLLAHDFMFRDAESTRELRRFVRIMRERGWTFRTIDHYTRSRPEPLRVAKYYGKKVKPVLAAAEQGGQGIGPVSDAYRPQETKQQPSIAVTAPSKSGNISLQAQLNEAVRRYESRRVEQLIRQGARINQRDEYGRLALNTAIRANSIHLVKKLLNYGADIRIKDANGYSALAAARSYKRSAIEKFLIEYSLKRGVTQQIVAINEKKHRIDPLKLLRQ